MHSSLIRSSFLLALLAALGSADRTAAVVDLIVEGCQSTDSCQFGGAGHGNGLVEPGEDVELGVVLMNQGTTTATGVSATVTTMTPGVTITQPNVTFADLFPFQPIFGSPPVLYSVDLTVACGTVIVLDLDITTDQGPFSGTCRAVIPVNCTPCAVAPNLVVDTCQHLDTCFATTPPTSDGNVDPGDQVELIVQLANTGTGPATGVSAVVTSSTTGVTITQGNLSFPDLAPTDVAAGTPPVIYSVDATVACGTTLEFDIAVSTDQGPFQLACQETIDPSCSPCGGQPNLQLDTCRHVDVCSSLGSNGVVDPGDEVEMFVGLANVGTAAATGVTAIVTSTTPGVTITQPNLTFSDLGPAGVVIGGPPIIYTVDATVPCGTVLEFAIAVTTDQGSFQLSCQHAIPDPCTPCVAPPAFFVEGCLHDATCPITGTTDSIVDPGDDVSLTIWIANIGAGPATGIFASVSSPTPGVTITQGSTTFPDLPASGLDMSQTPVLYSVDASVPCGTVLHFDISIGCDQGQFDVSCQYTIGANCAPCVPPNFTLAADGAALLSDDCPSPGGGGGDGMIDPGETITIDVTVRNLGPDDASGIVGTLVSLHPGVAVTTAVSTYPDLIGGNMATGMTPFELVLSAGLISCGEAIDLRLDLTTDEGLSFAGPVTGLSVAPNCTPCTPLDPPGEVPWMIARCAGGVVEVEWQPAPRADWYHVVMGTTGRRPITPAPWDHACEEANLTPPLVASLTGVPCGDGRDVYFLIVGANAVGQGPVGWATMDGTGPLGRMRPAGMTPCP